MWQLGLNQIFFEIQYNPVLGKDVIELLVL